MAEIEYQCFVGGLAWATDDHALEKAFGTYGEVIESKINMLQVRTPKTLRARREIEKRAPKLVENGKKTLILQGTKTTNLWNTVLTDIYHLKRGSATRYSRRNDNVKPFKSGGETSLEFFSLKTDCSLFVFGSHSKKRPHNLVLGRTYDHHIYDLVEVGVENFRSMESFSYDKKLAPKVGTKPFFAFIGEGFESVEELKHLKEVLLDLFRGEVIENLNLAGVDRVFVCTAISSNRVFLTHCALRLKRSGTVVPRMELVEVGPSMDLITRRHRLPNDGLRKEVMKTSLEKPKKVCHMITFLPLLPSLFASCLSFIFYATVVLTGVPQILSNDSTGACYSQSLNPSTL